MADRLCNAIRCCCCILASIDRLPTVLEASASECCVDGDLCVFVAFRILVAEIESEAEILEKGEKWKKGGAGKRSIDKKISRKFNRVNSQERN